MRMLTDKDPRVNPSAIVVGSGFAGSARHLPGPKGRHRVTLLEKQHIAGRARVLRGEPALTFDI